jgi:hypothetical protein
MAPGISITTRMSLYAEYSTKMSSSKYPIGFPPSVVDSSFGMKSLYGYGDSFLKRRKNHGV